ncbi:MAG: hypothetical protein V4712_06530 [Pseudomonadota bacterium]
MIRFCLVFMLLALPVHAQVATVRTGEHDIFSRIVVEAPDSTDWQFGRTDDGYELRLGSAPWRFDLAGVFDRIPRNRLAGIWADPATGNLRLGIGCACHAVPFEFRPGIIVIDLKDGPPPKGSAFEAGLQGGTTAALDARPAPKPRARPWAAPSGYDWTAARPSPPRPPEPAPAPKLEAAALVPLRDALLAQLSKGMAEGVVDMARPAPRQGFSAPAVASFSQLRLATGEMPGLTLDGNRPATGTLQPDGAACLDDQQLAIRDWGRDGAVSETLFEARAGLLTEFDAVNPDAIKRGAQQLIYLGFGAEARQLLTAFPLPASDPDLAALLSLARLIDGSPDPDGPFPAMAACDTAAALWAALAVQQAGSAPDLWISAMTRGFSALPPHLRTHLGPVLVERLLLSGNGKAVQAIRDAIARAPGQTGPEVAVMEARIALSQDQPAAAERQAQALLETAGPAVADATLALVEAQVMQAKPVSPETVTALQALLAEHQGTDLAPRLREALVVAKIAAGDAIGGFEALPDSPVAAPDAWRLLATLGPDSDLLALAVLPVDAPPPAAPAEVAAQIARRLIGLGFPDAAMIWLGRIGPEDDEKSRLLAAEAALQRQDGRAAMTALAGSQAPDAARLRALALTQLGDSRAASKAWADAGDADAASRGLIRAQDWAALAQTGPDPWRKAAGLAAGADPESVGPNSVDPEIVGAADGGPEGGIPASGPLAQSAALIAASAADRATLATLLSTVPQPQTSPLAP